MMAAAGFSFSSADGAEAYAQDAAAGVAAQTGQTGIEQPANQPVEIVPDQIVYASDEVVQPISESDAGGENSTIPAKVGSLRELVDMVGGDEHLSEQMRCLAGAVYFESRGEPLAGQLAVAHVVINRAEDGRWPASYCSVVHQRSQFSFVRNGRMPPINTSSAAWDRAASVARIAHDGLWDSEAPDAVYFHANYVSPRWSRSKTLLAQIDTHIFYR
jgi:hypothetical protein